MTENIKRALETIRSFSTEKFEQSLNDLQLNVDVTENFIFSFVQNLKGEYFLLPSQADIFIKYCDSLITKGYQVTKKDLEAIESMALIDKNLLVNFIIRALQNYQKKTLPFFAHLSIFKLEEISQMSADSEVQNKNLFFTAVKNSKFLKKLVHLFDIEPSNEKMRGWQPRAIRELSQEYQKYLLSLDDDLINTKIKSKLVENMTNNFPLHISEKENIEKAVRNGESISFCLGLTTSSGNHALGIYSVGSYLIISNSGYSEESPPYIKFYKLSPEEKVQFFAKNILTDKMTSVAEFEACMHELPNEPIVLECIKQEGPTCSWKAMQNNLLALWIIATLEPHTDDQLTAQQLKETCKKANIIFDRLYDSFCLNVLHEIIVIDKEAQSYLLQDPLAKEVLSECYDLCSQMKKNPSESKKFQELKRILGHGLKDYADLFATDYLKPLLNRGTLLFCTGSRDKNPVSPTQSSTSSMKQGPV